MQHSLRVLDRCDELWLVGGKISSGMLAEAKVSYHAQQFVRDFTGLGEEPPSVPPRLENVPLWKP